VARAGEDIENRVALQLHGAASEDAQPARRPVELLRELRQVDDTLTLRRETTDVAVALLKRHVQSEHLGLGRIVEQQLTGVQAELAREQVLHSPGECRIVGDPLRGIGGQVSGRTLQRTFVESALAQGAEPWARRPTSEVVEQPLVRERRERSGVEGAGVHSVFDKALVHRRRAAHRMMPIHVAVHLVASEEE
jgi:hypothetical protein